MRKRHWKDRKNRKCPECSKIMETIEKMKQPKTVQHKEKISQSITNWWENRKQQEIEYGFNRQQTTK